jgi:hypothetical protein
VWTWHYWGNLGGPLMLDGAPFSWEAFKAGSQGLLVDREHGLFVWAPIYLVLPVAWVAAGRRFAIWLLPSATLFLLSAAHYQWWGGFSPAARFLVPLVPIFACVAATAIRDRLFRIAGVALLLPQIFISADGWQHTRSLWPQGDGHNRILADLLNVVGATEHLMPSLRVSPDGYRAAICIAAVVLINLVVALQLRLRSQHR